MDCEVRKSAGYRRGQPPFFGEMHHLPCYLVVVVRTVVRGAALVFLLVVVRRLMLPVALRGAGLLAVEVVRLVVLRLAWLMLEPAGLLSVTPLPAGPLTVPGVVWAEATTVVSRQNRLLKATVQMVFFMECLESERSC